MTVEAGLNEAIAQEVMMMMAHVFVGVDWAQEQHEVHVVDAAGESLGERGFLNSPSGLDAMGYWLTELGGGEPAAVMVAIEVPHGPVVEFLMERGFAVHAINPKQLDRFRDRFSVAGAKDDRLDALVLASSLRTDTARFRKLEAEDPLIIELREWSRMHEELKGEQNRLANRLRQQLSRYYPQMLEMQPDVTREWLLALWERVPTPADIRRVRKVTIAKLLKAHRIRKIDAETIVATLRRPGFRVAPGTTEAATAHIGLIVPRLRMVNEQLKQCAKRLDAIIERLRPPEDDDDGEQHEQRDVDVLLSMPGIGRIVLATLLAEASRAINDRDYQALRTLTGCAPVTRRSGKSRVVLMRRACNPRLQNASYHWSRVAMQYDALSRQKYAALRSKGHAHGRALRSLTDRNLAVLVAMLRTRTRYDASKRRGAVPDDATRPNNIRERSEPPSPDETNLEFGVA